ncbi:pyridoxal kinase-like [Oppia nitens]|uniref:pyridoxal kinase-like n=1 Tax=Oppia nitens TaxID=1686743 RepID=UPI0023D9B1B3|nr:pyridoxal kinase-like [Oppia nitens]XP_054165505.1 pyridoxal kinase-like [Oppia nitens]
MSINSCTDDYRVLSIQSHVVSGYVGNKSAVFPLQVLGFEVDAINSVQFSTHTGYEHWKGQVLDSRDLLTVFDGLVKNDLHKQYTHILTGYAKNESFLESVLEVVNTVKQANPGAIYLCDPVMGDNGQMYVPQELLPVYKDKIILIADILTPNQFEAELLTGIKINNDSDAIQAIDALHDLGIPTVVISSSNLSQNSSHMVAIGSSRANGHKERIKLSFPKLNATFTGTGDLFAALFLAWFTKTNKDLKTTCENVISTLQAILKSTYDYAVQQPGGAKSVKNTELRLIQSRAQLESPQNNIKAIELV